MANLEVKGKGIKFLSKEQYENEEITDDYVYAVETPNEDELKKMMARMGKPSDKYIDLTLLASGSNYVAPDDGYFSLRKMSTNASQYVNLVTDNLYTDQVSIFANQELGVYIPVQKGHPVYSWHNAGGELLNFKFVYAEGAK